MGESEKIAATKLRPESEYTRERVAEFILTNAVDSEDYAAAVEEVRGMGLDPDIILHEKPPTE